MTPVIRQAVNEIKQLGYVTPATRERMSPQALVQARLMAEQEGA
jgi:hypothetical protein